MKCSTCCKCSPVCKQTGICQLQPAISQRSLMNAPKFLLVQLLRFQSHQISKVLTFVETRLDMKINNCIDYELLGVLDHIGTTINSGHYITKIRSEEDQWLLCNDQFVGPISADNIISANNYILLFKKKTNETLPDFVPTWEWQELKPGQSVPSGCHVKMDLGGSGRRMAKLNGEKRDHMQSQHTNPSPSGLYATKYNLIPEISNESDPHCNVQDETLDYISNEPSSPASTTKTCNLCINSSMHHCQICMKPVCNFCTEPVGEDEMKRKHKNGDQNCKLILTTNDIKESSINNNEMDSNTKQYQKTSSRLYANKFIMNSVPLKNISSKMKCHKSSNLDIIIKSLEEK